MWFSADAEGAIELRSRNVNRVITEVRIARFIIQMKSRVGEVPTAVCNVREDRVSEKVTGQNSENWKQQRHSCRAVAQGEREGGREEDGVSRARTRNNNLSGTPSTLKQASFSQLHATIVPIRRTTSMPSWSVFDWYMVALLHSKSPSMPSSSMSC